MPPTPHSHHHTTYTPHAPHNHTQQDFIDPITRYNNLGGYLFNIQMLRYVFAPDYIMHDIKQTGGM